MKEYGKHPLYRTFPTPAIVPRHPRFDKQHGGAAITSDLFLTTPQNKEVIQPEFRHCVAQMVSQPLYSVIFIYLSDAIASFLKKECEILNKISHKMYDLVVAYERHTHTAGAAASA